MTLFESKALFETKKGHPTEEIVALCSRCEENHANNQSAQKKYVGLNSGGSLSP